MTKNFNRPFPPRPRKGQGGFIMLSLTFATILISMWIANWAILKTYEAQEDAAKITGKKISKYNAAVAAFINGSQPNVPYGNYVGVGWLKQAGTCADGTGTESYLPCGFDDYLPFNLQFNTTIQQNGRFIKATTNLGSAVTGRGNDGAIGGKIVTAAEAHDGLASLRQQIEHQVGFDSYDIDVLTGNLIALIDTATTGDAYLRIDGNNAMAADLNAGGFNVNNAQDVNANRDLRSCLAKENRLESSPLFF